MKIKFNAEVLKKKLRPISATLPTSKLSQDDFIGIGAKDGALVAYGYCKGHWSRVETPINIEEPGVVVVSRSRFLKLLNALEGETTFRTTANNNRVELKAGSSNKFTLAQSIVQLPRPFISQGEKHWTIPAEPLERQLRLNTMDGELAGGYKITGKDKRLGIVVTDRQRLVLTDQAVEELGTLDFTMNLPASGVRGLFEILKLAPATVTIRYAPNLTSVSTTLEEGTKLEYGFSNETARPPDVSAILKKLTGINSGAFEVGGLLSSIDKLNALAETELPAADFNFRDTATCTLEVFHSDGSAEIGLGCTSELKDTCSIFRLQLPHLKSILGKAKACGASKVKCTWSDKEPVKWGFDFEEAEDRKFANINMLLVTVVMNRDAIIGRGTTA